MQQATTRREWLKCAAATGAAAAVTAGSSTASAQQRNGGQRRDRAAQDRPQQQRRDRSRLFSYCLNTATIRGQELSLREQVEVAIEAGYDAIEPWIPDIEQYEQAGGSIDDLAKRAADSDLRVASGIGFPQWIVDDAETRAAALEQARREMQLLKRLGGTHIAAPAAGATEGEKLDLDAVAERYHALLEVGREVGVVPQLEVWGFSVNLQKLREVMYVVTAAGHPDACVLGDVYHFYKGGSAMEGVRQLSRSATHCFHINDYIDKPREEIGDADRVFPGDGVGPVVEVVRALADNRCRCYLSLELFNRDYWQRDALAVAKEGLEKTRAVVAAI